jgi:hypothetical protein
MNDIYLVMRTFAILHEIPETKNVNAKDFETLMSPPVTAVATPSGIMISSQRDQIEIVIAGNKTDFRDLSGKTDFSSSKIEKVSQYFVDLLKLKANTLGINFVLRIPQPEPQKWILDNILSSEISKKVNKKLVGGSGSISLKSGLKTWNLVFEKTDKEQIGLNFNMSESIKKAPTSEEITKEFETQWKFLAKFLNELGL